MSPASGVFSPDVPESFMRGWEIGRRNFGARIAFFAPSLKRYTTAEFTQECDCVFPPVSLTGSDCALKCDHCRGGILKWMRPTTSPESLLAAAAEFAARGARGMLVSGGSDKTGVVPLKGFLDAIGKITARFGLRVIVHTGITSRKLARGLADAGVSAALIDIIGSDQTIRDVCHLPDVISENYGRSLENLCEAGVPASPHVVIGLHHGKLDGEFHALKTVSNHDVSSLVLIGLLPTRGTPMAGASPPSPEEMGEVFLAARELLPQTPVLLGCERPAGEHKAETDSLALKAGLNGIAYPAEGIIGLAKEMGLEPELSGMCCALPPVETGGQQAQKGGGG